MSHYYFMKYKTPAIEIDQIHNKAMSKGVGLKLLGTKKVNTV